VATVVESQAAEETEVIFVRFASLNVSIEWGDSQVVPDITW